MDKVRILKKSDVLGTNTEIWLQYSNGECKCTIGDLSTGEVYEQTIQGNLKDGFKWCMETIKKYEIGKH